MIGYELIAAMLVSDARVLRTSAGGGDRPTLHRSARPSGGTNLGGLRFIGRKPDANVITAAKERCITTDLTIGSGGGGARDEFDWS